MMSRNCSTLYNLPPTAYPCSSRCRGCEDTRPVPEGAKIQDRSTITSTIKKNRSVEAAYIAGGRKVCCELRWRVSLLFSCEVGGFERYPHHFKILTFYCTSLQQSQPPHRFKIMLLDSLHVKLDSTFGIKASRCYATARKRLTVDLRNKTTMKTSINEHAE